MSYKVDHYCVIGQLLLIVKITHEYNNLKNECLKKSYIVAVWFSPFPSCSDCYMPAMKCEKWKIKHGAGKTRTYCMPSACFQLSATFCPAEGEVESSVNPCCASDSTLVLLTWGGACLPPSLRLLHSAVSSWTNILHLLSKPAVWKEQKMSLSGRQELLTVSLLNGQMAFSKFCVETCQVLKHSRYMTAAILNTKQSCHPGKLQVRSLLTNHKSRCCSFGLLIARD